MTKTQIREDNGLRRALCPCSWKSARWPNTHLAWRALRRHLYGSTKHLVGAQEPVFET